MTGVINGHHTFLHQDHDLLGGSWCWPTEPNSLAKLWYQFWVRPRTNLSPCGRRRSILKKNANTTAYLLEHTGDMNARHTTQMAAKFSRVFWSVYFTYIFILPKLHYQVAGGRVSALKPDWFVTSWAKRASSARFTPIASYSSVCLRWNSSFRRRPSNGGWHQHGAS